MDFAQSLESPTSLMARFEENHKKDGLFLKPGPEVLSFSFNGSWYLEIAKK